MKKLVQRWVIIEKTTLHYFGNREYNSALGAYANEKDAREMCASLGGDYLVCECFMEVGG